jgi:pimeloyl-ACP methyl ester carboxylesterase
MYSLDAYVTMMDQFIDQLGVARPVYIIGHSLGAAVGLRYTIKHPENVEKLVAVSLPINNTYINNKLPRQRPRSGDEPPAGQAEQLPGSRYRNQKSGSGRLQAVDQ